VETPAPGLRLGSNCDVTCGSAFTVAKLAGGAYRIRSESDGGLAGDTTRSNPLIDFTVVTWLR
jgi:hypothetical protein